MLTNKKIHFKFRRAFKIISLKRNQNILNGGKQWQQHVSKVKRSLIFVFELSYMSPISRF